MKYNKSSLTSTLGALLNRNKMDLYQLAEASGIDFDKLQRWRTRKDYCVSPKELLSLARVFSPKGKALVDTHADLLDGHLNDLCTGPGSELISVERLPYSHWMITTSLGRVYLTPGVLSNLHTICNVVPYNKNVRAMLRSIVKYCEKEGLTR